MDELNQLLTELTLKRNMLKSYEEQLSQRKAEERASVGDGRFAENISFLEDQIANLKKEIFNTEDIIDRLAEKLDATERTIIRERYIKNKNWRQIQRITGYADSQPYKLRRRALKKLSQILKEDRKG